MNRPDTGEGQDAAPAFTMLGDAHADAVVCVGDVCAIMGDSVDEHDE